MKNTIFMFLLVFAIPACADVHYPPTTLDEIKCFLEERINGERTGNFMFINLSIFTIDGKIGWSTSRARLYKYHKDDPFFGMNMEESTSVWSFSTPHLSNVKWKPGNQVIANYDMTSNCGQPMLFVAKRVGSKEKDAWAVKITGVFCDIDIEASKKQKWEYATVNNVELTKATLSTWDRYKK